MAVTNEPEWIIRLVRRMHKSSLQPVHTGQRDSVTKEAWATETWTAVLDDEIDIQGKIEELVGKTMNGGMLPSFEC